MLTTAAAHDPGWRNAFAATANSLAQSGEVPLIGGDYSGPTPWIASSARDGAVLGRVFVALGMDYQPVADANQVGEPAQTGLATGAPQVAAEPVSGSPLPVSGAPAEATAAVPTSASPHQPADLGYPYETQQGGSPHTVSPFSVPPAGPPQRSKAPLIGIVVLVLVVLLGGGGVLAFVLWPDGEPQTQPTDGPTTPSPLQQGLVGRWDLDEGSGTTANDSSGMGNHATLIDGVGWTGDGHGGTPAVEFDDPPGILETDGPVVLTNQSFTVSAWVRLAQETDHHQYVVWQPGAEASAFVLQYREDGLWGFSVTSNDGENVTWHELSSNSSAVIEEWTHLVGVHDREQGEIRIYVNGTFEARAEATAQASVSGLLIGNAGTGRIHGTVDSVHVYQAALTDEQVTELYEAQQAGA